jgi:hypothetical protein
MALEITTNNVPRDILDSYELTAKEREEFDYLDWDKLERGEDSASFVRYKRWVYHLGDIMLSPIPGWDGIAHDSFFSGVLFRYVDNGERIVCATYYDGVPDGVHDCNCIRCDS